MSQAGARKVDVDCLVGEVIALFPGNRKRNWDGLMLIKVICAKERQSYQIVMNLCTSIVH